MVAKRANSDMEESKTPEKGFPKASISVDNGSLLIADAQL